MSEAEENYLSGEDPGMDLTDSVAKRANRKLMESGDNPNILAPMGELGDIPVNDIRVWRSGQPGKLIAFVRKETGEHKVITATVVTLGLVATAIGSIKYINNKK
jgi:hypothetical protein